MRPVRLERPPRTFQELESARQLALRERFAEVLRSRFAELGKDRSRDDVAAVCEELSGWFGKFGADNAVWAFSRMLRFRAFSSDDVLYMLNEIGALQPRDPQAFFKKLTVPWHACRSVMIH